MDEKLRHILLQASLQRCFPTLDPRTLIRAVNALHPLGKEKALAVMGQFVALRRRKHDQCDFDGLFLVLRCLFQIPQPLGFMPRIRIGAPSPPEPSDRKNAPYFPLILVDDLPVLMITGYQMGGEPEPAEEHITYFQKYGTLRPTLLAPTSRPLELLTKMESSPQCLWKKPYHTNSWHGETAWIKPDNYEVRWIRHGVQEQLLRVVKSFYPAGISRFKEEDDEKRMEAIWHKAEKDMSRLRLRWDEAKGDYVLD